MKRRYCAKAPYEPPVDNLFYEIYVYSNFKMKSTGRHILNIENILYSLK